MATLRKIWQGGVATRTASTEDRDEKLLASLGYKQELKRDISLFSNFAVSFSIISILTGVMSPAYGSVAMVYGGPVTAIWGWPLVCLFSFIVSLAMAEICSAYPTAGGLYFWAARLAGPEWAPLASWVTGWFNLLGQLAITAGIAFTCVTFIGAFISIASGGANNGGIVLDTKQMLGVYAALLAVWGILNSISVKLAGYLADASVWWHVVGTIVIIILLPSAAPSHQPAETVFEGFAQNGDTTGVTNNFYIFALGLLYSQWSITGYDASAHMAEETVNAAVAGPLGICSSVAISAVFGWALILALTFSTRDPANLLSPDTATGGQNGAFQIIYDVFDGRWGKGKASLVLLTIPLVACFFCGVASVTANSRMLYAFSRDGAVPGSRWWRKLQKQTKTPVNAVWAMVVGAFILGTPMLDNVTAFAAVTSIATIGLYISYVIPVVVKLLIARNTTWQPGPFNLGRFSSPLGIVAIVWVAFICVVFCLPTMYPVTKENLNYAPVAVGTLLVACVGWWIVPVYGARHWFKGPPQAGELPASPYDGGDASYGSGSVAWEARVDDVEVPVVKDVSP